jgi:DNA-binding HxlR family transcriptional regulator
MARTNIYQHFCPIARSLEVIGEKWSLLIVRDLLDGPQRFTDLIRGLPNITPKWLTMRLRELEAAGLLERTQEEGRREVWYALTAKGQELGPVIGALNVWGTRNAVRPLLPDEEVRPGRILDSLRGYLITARVRPARPLLLAFSFGDGKARGLRFDGRRWMREPEVEGADVTITTTPAQWVDLLATHPADPLAMIAVEGEPDAVAEVEQILLAMTRTRTKAPASAG